MHYWTVVLLRCPALNELTEERYGKDVYVAHVTETTAGEALAAARKEAYTVDRRDMGVRKLKGLGIRADEESYRLCVMFQGHHEVEHFGWNEH